MQHNCLSSLAGIENAPGLVSLNVSSNCLSRLDELAACLDLTSLVAEHNHLESLESLEVLAACSKLQTLDLQHNNIADPALLQLLQRLPDLRCLYLKGNPVVGKVPSYRKALIAALPELTYLDDRPVFEEERNCAEAWCVRIKFMMLGLRAFVGGMKQHTGHLNTAEVLNDLGVLPCYELRCAV